MSPSTTPPAPAAPPSGSNGTAPAKIRVEGLTMAYGSFVVQRDLSFDVQAGQILVIMGASGCGKSTLMKHMIGLRDPAAGAIHYDGFPFSAADEDARQRWQRRFGVLYQSGALWSSLSVAENIALPLEQFTRLSAKEIDELVRYKLALVSLEHAADKLPAQLSGGMRKRAGLARALALDPEILFLDEPSAGLDPVTSRRLDDTILSIRDSVGATVVVVSHELASIFAIGDQAAFLDVKARTLTAFGPPRELLRTPPNAEVGSFLTRAGKEDEQLGINSPLPPRLNPPESTAEGV